MPHRSIEELVSSIAYHRSHDESRNGLRILRELAKTCKTQEEFTASLGPWLDHRRLNMGSICGKLPMQGAQKYDFRYNYTVGLPWPGEKLAFSIVGTDGGVSNGVGRPPLVCAPQHNALQYQASDSLFTQAEVGLSRAGEWVLLVGKWKKQKKQRSSKSSDCGSHFELQEANVVIYASAQELSLALVDFFPIYGIKSYLSTPQRYLVYVLEMILEEREEQLKVALREIRHQQEWQWRDTDQVVVIREGLPTEVAPTSST